MTPEHFNALTEEVRQLVRDIQSFANKEIDVVIDPNASTDPIERTLRTEVTHEAATIFLPDAESWTSELAVHELLRIQRYWVERVPMVFPADAEKHPNRVLVMSGIENCIENAIVVPREAGFGFDPYGRWNELYKMHLDREPWTKWTDPWVLRKNLLLNAVTFHTLVTDSTLKARLRAVLVEKGLVEDADQLVKKIQRVSPNKEHMASALARFIGIPANECILVVCDIKNRKAQAYEFPKE